MNNNIFCSEPINWIDINPDWWVKFCCKWKFKIWNINNQSLQEIYDNNKKLKVKIIKWD